MIASACNIYIYMRFRNGSIFKDCKIVLSKSKRNKIYSLYKEQEKNINLYSIKNSPLFN